MKIRPATLPIVILICCSCSLNEQASAVENTSLDKFKEQFQEKYKGNFDFDDGWYTAFSTTDYRETHAGTNDHVMSNGSFEESRITGNFRFSKRYAFVLLTDDFKQTTVTNKTCLTAETDEMSCFYQMGSSYPWYTETSIVDGNTVYSAKGFYSMQSGVISHGEQTKVKTRDDWPYPAEVSFQFTDYFNQLDAYERLSGRRYSEEEDYSSAGRSDIPYYVHNENSNNYYGFFTDSFDGNILSIEHHFCDSAPVSPKVNHICKCDYYFDDDLQIYRVEERIVKSVYETDVRKQDGYYQKIWDYHLSFRKCDPISITIPSSEYDEEYTGSYKGFVLV